MHIFKIKSRQAICWEKEVIMSEDKRDYAADLEICEKATPGPVKWQKFGYAYYLTGQYGMRPIILSTINIEKEGYMDEIHISNRDAERDLLIPLDPKHPDSMFIEMAWEALPWYIRRVMELEAQLTNKTGTIQDHCRANEGMIAEIKALRTRLAASEGREGALRDALEKALSQWAMYSESGRGLDTGYDYLDRGGDPEAKLYQQCKQALSTPAPVNLEAMRRVVEAARELIQESRLVDPAQRECIDYVVPRRQHGLFVGAIAEYEALAALERGWGGVKRVGNHVTLDNDTVWPLVEKDENGGLEWRLRYGNPSREDILEAAGIVAAYDYLINALTHKQQREILRQLKKAEQEVPADES